MVAAIGDLSVDFGASPILDLAATGVNGAPLAFSASPLPLPAGASLSGASGLFTFTPDATQVGDIALSFIVSDGLNTGGGGEEGANTASRVVFSVPAQPVRRPGRWFPILDRLIGAFGGDFQ